MSEAKRPTELQPGDIVGADSAVVISYADEQPDGSVCVMVRDEQGYRELRDFPNNDHIPIIRGET